MTTQTEITHETQRSRNSSSKLLWVSPLAMAVATAANLVLYTIAGSLLPEVAIWPGAGVPQIVGATIVYLLIGTVVFALVNRFSARPARHFLIIATIGLFLSLALPIAAVFGYGTPPGTPPASVATAVTLSLMHVLTYAISVPMFIRLAKN
jgi:hypothetical protein